MNWTANLCRRPASESSVKFRRPPGADVHVILRIQVSGEVGDGRTTARPPRRGVSASGCAARRLRCHCRDELQRASAGGPSQRRAASVTCPRWSRPWRPNSCERQLRSLPGSGSRRSSFMLYCSAEIERYQRLVLSTTIRDCSRSFANFDPFQTEAARHTLACWCAAASAGVSRTCATPVL